MTERTVQVERPVEESVEVCDHCGTAVDDRPSTVFKPFGDSTIRDPPTLHYHDDCLEQATVAEDIEVVHRSIATESSRPVLLVLDPIDVVFLLAGVALAMWGVALAMWGATEASLFIIGVAAVIFIMFGAIGYGQSTDPINELLGEN